jgi:hypothetical protein
MGYVKDDVVRFFMLAVNPALTGCDSELEERGWSIDKLQIPDPADPVSWSDSKLTSLIEASKTEGENKVRFVYIIWVEGSGDDYNISREMDQYRGPKIKNLTDVYPYDINNTTQDRFRSQIRTFYKEVAAQPSIRSWG